MTLIRDAGGVSGLHVLLDAFTEDVERRIFQTGEPLNQPEQVNHEYGKRLGCHLGPEGFDAVPDLHRVCNAIRDSGLFPGLVEPDYCFAITYPGPSADGGGAEFQVHLDSRYRWGETVCGVTMGQGCLMRFQALTDAVKRRGPPAGPSPGSLLQWTVVETAGGFSVDVQLPRRSIYVMSGAVRTEWKHGIRKLSTKNLAPFPPPPAWNTFGMRRSLTLRPTKAYSDACLEQQLREAPGDAALQARLTAQRKYPPQRGDEKPNAADLRALRERGAELARQLNAGRATRFRFEPHEVNFPVDYAKGDGGPRGAASMPAQLGGTCQLGNRGGYRLGGNCSIQQPAPLDEDEQMKRAIALSLQETEQRPARFSQPPAAAAAASSSSSSSGIVTVDLTSDNEDDAPPPAKRARTDEPPTASPTPTKEGQLEAARLARLRRFGVA